MSKVPVWFPPAALLVAAGVVVVCVMTRSGTSVKVPTHDTAMRPAIGDETTFSADPSWLARPVRDAIVAFMPPGSAEGRVARAVALAGDKIEVRGGKVYVNGAVPKGNKRRVPGGVDVPEFVCPRDCVYLLADKVPKGPADSVVVGPVPLWRVLGSVSP